MYASNGPASTSNADPSLLRSCGTTASTSFFNAASPCVEDVSFSRGAGVSPATRHRRAESSRCRSSREVCRASWASAGAFGRDGSRTGSWHLEVSDPRRSCRPCWSERRPSRRRTRRISRRSSPGWEPTGLRCGLRPARATRRRARSSSRASVATPVTAWASRRRSRRRLGSV